MSSKKSFFQAIQLSSSDLKENVIVLSCPDGLFFKFIKQKWKKFLPSLATKVSSEVNREWLDNTLMGLSLFGNDEFMAFLRIKPMNSSFKKYIKAKKRSE